MSTLWHILVYVVRLIWLLVHQKDFCSEFDADQSSWFGDVVNLKSTRISRRCIDHDLFYPQSVHSRHLFNDCQ
jgi:hypothetical protein